MRPDRRTAVGPDDPGSGSPPDAIAGIVDRAVADDGSELLLHQRDGVWQIRIDGRELMDSRHHHTERALATLACQHLPPVTAPHVLIGGLGMGFTLRAALDCLPADARVTVVELFGAVIAWHDGPLAALANQPLADPRVTVVQGDVTEVLGRSPEAFDALVLDVDNGPHDLALAGNRRLYGPAGLAVLRRALRPGGVVAVWSARPAPDLEARWRRAGLLAWSETVPAVPGDDRLQHTIIMARRPDAGQDTRVEQ